jgi:putative ABC transport system permease protein
MTAMLRGLLHRLRVLVAAESYSREVEAEMRFHMDLEAMQQRSSGVSPNEAQWAARKRFGNVTYQRDEVRRMSGIEALDRIRQDAAYAWRGIRRAPGFAALIAIMLALAVGANAAVFSLIDPLFFRPPPGVVDPGSVRRLYANHPHAINATANRSVGERFSYPEFLSIRSMLAGSAVVAAYLQLDSVFVGHGGDSVASNVTYATPAFLSMLGTRPSRGRLFVEQDDQVNAAATVAVVSQPFAARTFGDSSPIDQTVTVAGTAYVIVGVAPADFEGIDWSTSDIWLPFSTMPRDAGRGPPWYQSYDRYIQLIARLGPGFDDRALEARASVAYVRAYQSDDELEQGRAVLAGPIVAARGPGNTPQELTIATALAVVAGILLLIACANIANLLLARALLRRREIAVRLSLGISRARLASQLLVESLVLAMIGGVGAILGAGWASAALRLALTPRMRWIGAPIGGRVMAFTAAITIGAALIAAIVPALLASRTDLNDALKGSARDGTLQRPRIRGALLVIQAGFSMLLLVGAALFAKSLRNVRAIDLGLDAERLVVTGVGFADQARVAHREVGLLLPSLAERISRIPGVTGVSYGYGAPFNQHFSGIDLFAADDGAALTRRGRQAEYIAVTTNHFSVAGTRIVAGRGFLPSDQRDSRKVMVVSAAMAQSLWPGANPLGKCVIPEERSWPCYTIVGIAEDAHQFRIFEEKAVAFYLPLAQTKWPPSNLLVRVGSGQPQVIAELARRELQRAFPGARITSLAVSDRLAGEVRPWKLGAQLFSALSILALVVAMIGVYGVVAFHARQRTHEMGIRVALGAQRQDLIRLVVGTGVGIVAIGVVLGIVASLGAGKLVASLLYGVSPRDPASLLEATVVLLMVGALASFGPAWQASNVDPARVLRDE